MKQYTMLASRPGGYMNWPGHSCSSRLNARAAAVLMFRKWFGHEPDKSWFWKGNMAQASDRRGNVVEIDQHQSGPLRVVRYDPAFAAFQRTLALAS